MDQYYPSFSWERIFPPPSLFVRGNPPPTFKSREKYQLLNCLLSCVKVCLGPVDTTILIWVRVGVLDCIVTSHVFLINHLLFEDLEVQCKSFIRLDKWQF